nr:MAG TPA: hypothetical protein [Caudoviricetes sp.]
MDSRVAYHSDINLILAQARYPSVDSKESPLFRYRSRMNELK